MRNRTEDKVIEFFFIRHGKTEGNRHKRYIGRTDETLCAEGRSELLEKQKETADVIFSSPMLRCIETAEILFPGQKPVLIEEWREMDFGDFEGRNYLELKENPAYQKWIDSNGELPFPNGESREQFLQRTMRGMEKMFAWLEETPAAEKAACIVHGGTIMALASRESGGAYFDFQCGNGEGYRFVYACGGGRRRLLSCEKQT